MGFFGFLLVFVGGGLGSAARHGMNVLGTRWWGVNYPFATLAINIAGAFLMGVLFEYLAVKAELPQSARLFLATGVLGGFTTFSTFALEIGLLFERGEWVLALAYAAGSVVLGLAALFAGSGLVRWLTI